MPIHVVGAEFKSKLKSLIAESAFEIEDIDACIMCGKPVNLQYLESYVYDFEGEVWCAACVTVETDGSVDKVIDQKRKEEKSCQKQS